MEFIWNDGGRATCGFIGLTGDCVTRAIAIGTGAVYRDIYAQLGEASAKSPRDGIPIPIISEYMAECGWDQATSADEPFRLEALPKGVVLVHICKKTGRCHHLTTVIDHVVHDTWNPAEDEEYIVKHVWAPSASQLETTLPSLGPKRRASAADELNQQEFDKILRRLRALDKTASNDASTEGEKRNALRMMQNLMLSHNLTRDDIVGNDNVDQLQFTRMACPVNGRRACGWEKNLAMYVVLELIPTVQCYISTKGHRTMFWFYGPLADVQNSIALYRELLLTIATSAQLQYGSYTRGSGASYAEGYVAGLPRSSTVETDEGRTTQSTHTTSERALIQARMLSLRDAAKQWLDVECNIRLTSGSRRGRYQHDPAAETQGRAHGAQHEVNVPNATKRITQQ